MRVRFSSATAVASRTFALLSRQDHCSRLFCTSGQSASDGAAVLRLPNDEEPFTHSNPRIQVFLDRYKKLCDMQPPPVEDTIEALPDKSDSRSPTRAVFSNNLVDLSRVEVVGFDYDYTLATCESFSF